VREGWRQQVPDGQVVSIRAEVTSLDNRSNLKRPSERFYGSEPYNGLWAVVVKLRSSSDSKKATVYVLRPALVYGVEIVVP
jgi:hypothetical protein